jgi:hypothetical protein
LTVGVQFELAIFVAHAYLAVACRPVFTGHSLPNHQIPLFRVVINALTVAFQKN